MLPVSLDMTDGCLCGELPHGVTCVAAGNHKYHCTLWHNLLLELESLTLRCTSWVSVDNLHRAQAR